MADKFDVKFDFRCLPGKTYPSVESKDSEEWLMKWGMERRIRIQCFSFDQEFKTYKSQIFAEAFFNDPEVIRNLGVLSSSNKWNSIGQAPSKVRITTIPATVISMNFFDRLHDSGIVRESGNIQKCMDEFVGDFVVSDELRKDSGKIFFRILTKRLDRLLATPCKVYSPQMFLMEDESEHSDLYSETEKDEFLFRLLRHICLGGQLCQYEDELKPYLDITKSLYKDLVSVVKEEDSKQMRIISHVLQVSCEDESGVFYPANEEHEQNFSYLVIDPLKRHVTVCYHRYGSGAPALGRSYACPSV